MPSLEEWSTRPGGLATRLKDLREAAGIRTQAEMARRLGAGWDPPKVSRIENGRRLPTEADILAWCRETGAAAEAAALIELRGEGQAVHDEYRQHLQEVGEGNIHRDVIAMIREADRVDEFEPVMIPGLLQTAGYARYQIRRAIERHGGDPDKVEEAVGARMLWQQPLYTATTTKQFRFVICEAALCQLVCPPEIMAEQIDRLVTLLDVPHIKIGIVPFGRVLSLPPVSGYLTTGDATLIETMTGDNWLAGDESARYPGFTDQLLKDAVTGSVARDLLLAASRRLRDANPGG